MKRSFGLAVLICSLFLFAGRSFAEFYGDPAIGLVDFKEDQYGASYYVPEDYDPKADWPLLVVIYSDEAEKGKFFVEKWLAEAKKRKTIALFISYLSPREMPFGSDERTLKILHEIKRRYSITDDKIMLSAFGEAAHYAYYLAFKYPSEFRAAGLIGGGAVGRYEPFLNFGHSRAKNVSFLILYGKHDSTIDPAGFVAKHKELTEHGHDIEMEEFEGLDHKTYPEQIAKAMDWFGSLPTERNQESPESQTNSGPVNFVSDVVHGVLKR